MLESALVKLEAKFACELCDPKYSRYTRALHFFPYKSHYFSRVSCSTHYFSAVSMKGCGERAFSRSLYAGEDADSSGVQSVMPLNVLYHKVYNRIILYFSFRGQKVNSTLNKNPYLNNWGKSQLLKILKL